MSRVIASRRTADHFEPDDAVDPKAQRQLRGLLEQIDYTAYTANRTVLSAALAGIDAEKFQRMATAIAVARARWVATALALSEAGKSPTSEQVASLTQLRTAYEELAEAYNGMRRMVERGYIAYAPPPGSNPA